MSYQAVYFREVKAIIKSNRMVKLVNQSEEIIQEVVV